MDHTMNQANADGQDGLFTTETAGLPEVASPCVIRLRDGDRLDLRIGPVRKRLDDAELRMLAYNGSIPGPTLHVGQGSEITVQVRNDGDVEATVHWHGLRLENRYDGVPDETQVPIPIGGTYTCRVGFPDAGFYWYHPHIREDFGLEMGLYGTIVVEPADPSYWPAEEVLLAPSERAVIDVLFDTPGQVRLEPRTPDHTYDLGAFTVAEGAPGAAGSFEVLRTDPELTAEHQSIGHDIERTPDKVLAF